MVTTRGGGDSQQSAYSLSAPVQKGPLTTLTGLLGYACPSQAAVPFREPERLPLAIARSAEERFSSPALSASRGRWRWAFQQYTTNENAERKLWGRKEEVEHMDGPCYTTSGLAAYSYILIISLSGRKREYCEKLPQMEYYQETYYLRITSKGKQ